MRADISLGLQSLSVSTYDRAIDFYHIWAIGQLLWTCPRFPGFVALPCYSDFLAYFKLWKYDGASIVLAFGLLPFYTLGYRRFADIGYKVRVLLDINRWDRLEPTPCVGVFLWSKSASQESLLSLCAFLNTFLTTFTADSALPFDLACVGEEVTCLNSHVEEKVVNSLLENCGPLSVTRTSGIPRRLNCCFRNRMTSLEIVLRSSPTSIKSE